MPDYRQWGMAQSRVLELSVATGVNITFGAIQMERESDWTPTAVSFYLLWLTPAILSLAVPIGFILLRACRPKDGIAGEVLAALRRVEIEEVRPRMGPRVEAQAELCCHS